MSNECLCAAFRMPLSGVSFAVGRSGGNVKRVFLLGLSDPLLTSLCMHGCTPHCAGIATCGRTMHNVNHALCLSDHISKYGLFGTAVSVSTVTREGTLNFRVWIARWPIAVGYPVSSVA
jgi:hypothetical protein